MRYVASTGEGGEGLHAGGAERDVYATEAAESGDLLLNGNSLNEAAT
jgi:hypothetical protein